MSVHVVLYAFACVCFLQHAARGRRGGGRRQRGDDGSGSCGGGVGGGGKRGRQKSSPMVVCVLILGDLGFVFVCFVFLMLRLCLVLDCLLSYMFLHFARCHVVWRGPRTMSERLEATTERSRALPLIDV